MRNSRNRLTPFLIITLIVLVWILIFIIGYKIMKISSQNNLKKLKLDDDLVQELYSYITEEDVKLYIEDSYDVDDLPDSYIFSKATRFLAVEEIVFKGSQFILSYDSLDGAIKTAFGPDFEYDLSNLNCKVKTYIKVNENDIVVDVKYDSNINSYVGTYTESIKEDIIKLKYDLTQATKKDNVDLKIGYTYYKEDGNYKICNNKNCDEIIKELDNITEYKYDKFIIVSLKKASDEIYYYNSNS